MFLIVVDNRGADSGVWGDESLKTEVRVDATWKKQETMKVTGVLEAFCLK